MKILKIAIIFLGIPICMPGCQSAKNCSPDELLISIKNRDKKTFDQCLEGDTDINYQDNNGNSILMITAQSGLTSFAQSLIEKGVNADLFNNSEQNAAKIAHKAGNFEIEKMIKEYQLKHWQQMENKDSEDILLAAIGQDNELIIENYIANGKDFNDKTEDGIAFMAFAIFAGSPSIVNVFLDNNVNPNAIFDFRPVLSIAAMFGEDEIIQMLLEEGAEIDALDGPGQTALMFAAENGNTEAVRILLKAGADETIKDRQGETARDKAMKKNHIEILNILRPIDTEDSAK